MRFSIRESGLEGARLLRVVAGPLLNRFAARTNFLIVIGGAALGLILLAVSIGPLVMQTDALSFERGKELLPPSADHWFGTDRFGRDFFARVLEGGRVSLTAAFIAMSLILAIGITLGAIAGYLGSWVDGAVMRIVDVLLALPPFVAAIAIAGLFGTGLQVILIGVVTLWWAWYARITRGIVLQVKERLHVDAAKAAGATTFSIVFREIVPLAAGPVIVVATLDLGSLILTIAGLSFLGLGEQPPNPEWGTLLSEGRAYFLVSPHLTLFPGLMIFLTVLALNLLGEGLHERLDPYNLAGRGG